MNTVRINATINNEQLLLTDLKKFIGKNVEIFISEVKDNTVKMKKWHLSGSVKLNGILDEKNIRNLAYD